MREFEKEYLDDSMGASDYVEYLEGRLSSQISQLKDAIDFGQKMYNAMDMQLGRENESLHIPAHVAWDIYVRSMHNWNNFYRLYFPEYDKTKWRLDNYEKSR